MGHYNPNMWTLKDVRFLEKHYRTYSTNWIARKLNRSTPAVYNKARSKGLKKVNPVMLKKLAGRREKARRAWARRGR